MWQKNVRYLDYNATSGISLLVREKLKELLASEEILANPSSRHRAGQSARKLIHDASMQVAKSLSADQDASLLAEGILFTSSGTEANQTVLKSIAKKAELILIGAGEHSASRDWAEHASLSLSVPVQEVPLLPNGQYDLDALANLMAEAKASHLSQIGLSLTLANNETGVLLQWEALQSILQKSGLTIFLHFDGAQAWGKVDLPFREIQPSFITFSSHKIGALSGTGVIWKAKHATLDPLILGSQSQGQRGGSENLLGIVATGVAAQALNPKSFAAHTRPLRDQLEQGLKSLGYPIRIWGEESPRVPNTSRFSLLHYKTYENWVELLDLKGFAVSHGSACKAQIIEPSHVLMKMGASKEDALNSLRVSLGPPNTSIEIDEFLIALKSILSQKETSRR